MLRKVLVVLALTFSASVFADDCATRVITDKLYDKSGASIMSEQSKTSCGNAGSNLQTLVGIDQQCYYYEVRGQQQLACQYPNGNWVTFGDIEAIDLFAGGNDPQSGKYSAHTEYVPSNGSMLIVLNNFINWYRGTLDKESQELHARSVLFALENSNNGQLVTWTNKKGTEMGRIKVVSTVPVQGGICRRMLVELTVGDRIRNLNETACYNISTNKWSFIQ